MLLNVWKGRSGQDSLSSKWLYVNDDVPYEKITICTVTEIRNKGKYVYRIGQNKNGRM
jgi:hypothetical protein